MSQTLSLQTDMGGDPSMSQVYPGQEELMHLALRGEGPAPSCPNRLFLAHTALVPLCHVMKVYATLHTVSAIYDQSWPEEVFDMYYISGEDRRSRLT